MADRYLDSAATASSPYESASTAANTLATLVALTLAVDEEIWVNTTHSESTASGLTFTSPSAATRIAPQRLIVVSDFASATPPVTVSTGAQIATTLGSNITFSGHWYIEGITLSAGSGANNASMAFGAQVNSSITVKNCKIILAGTGSTSSLSVGPGADTNNDEHRTILDSCNVKFSATGHKIVLRHGLNYINNLSIDAAGSAPTTLFSTAQASTVNSIVENSDLTGKTWTNLFTPAATAGTLTFRNCKFPSGWGPVTGSFPGPGFSLNIHNCSSGSDNYTYEKHQYEGSIFLDTGKYATTNPASDGTTSYSWRMASSNASRFLPLYSDWIHVWVDSTSTAIAPSVEILVGADGAAALTDADVWLEVDEMDTASTPKGTRVTDAPATILTAGTNQDAGTTAWTGDGYTTERTHKLAVPSFTPDQKGYIRCRVALAKSSTTIYVNPKVALS